VFAHERNMPCSRDGGSPERQSLTSLRDESHRIAVCAPQTEMEVIGLGRVVIGPPAT